jgi:hypothetical protein
MFVCLAATKYVCRDFASSAACAGFKHYGTPVTDFMAADPL